MRDVFTEYCTGSVVSTPDAWFFLKRSHSRKTERMDYEGKQTVNQSSSVMVARNNFRFMCKCIEQSLGARLLNGSPDVTENIDDV